MKRFVQNTWASGIPILSGWMSVLYKVREEKGSGFLLLSSRSCLGSGCYPGQAAVGKGHSAVSFGWKDECSRTPRGKQQL